MIPPDRTPIARDLDLLIGDLQTWGTTSVNSLRAVAERIDQLERAARDPAIVETLAQARHNCNVGLPEWTDAERQRALILAGNIGVFLNLVAPQLEVDSR